MGYVKYGVSKNVKNLSISEKKDTISEINSIILRLSAEKNSLVPGNISLQSNIERLRSLLQSQEIAHNPDAYKHVVDKIQSHFSVRDIKSIQPGSVQSVLTKIDLDNKDLFENGVNPKYNPRFLHSLFMPNDYEYNVYVSQVDGSILQIRKKHEMYAKNTKIVIMNLANKDLDGRDIAKKMNLSEDTDVEIITMINNNVKSKSTKLGKLIPSNSNIVILLAVLLILVLILIIYKLYRDQNMIQ
jgi:hypothetical protein